MLSCENVWNLLSIKNLYKKYWFTKPRKSTPQVTFIRKSSSGVVAPRQKKLSKSIARKITELVPQKWEKFRRHWQISAQSYTARETATQISGISSVNTVIPTIRFLISKRKRKRSWWTSIRHYTRTFSWSLSLYGVYSNTKTTCRLYWRSFVQILKSSHKREDGRTKEELWTQSRRNFWGHWRWGFIYGGELNLFFVMPCGPRDL